MHINQGQTVPHFQLQREDYCAVWPDIFWCMAFYMVGTKKPYLYSRCTWLTATFPLFFWTVSQRWTGTDFFQPIMSAPKPTIRAPSWGNGLRREDQEGGSSQGTALGVQNMWNSLPLEMVISSHWLEKELCFDKEVLLSDRS